MKVLPQSEIYLYSGIETSRPLIFRTASARDTYFSNHVVSGVGGNEYMTVKKAPSRLRLQIAGTVAKTVNYISFKNPAFDNKIFYARVIDYDFINTECTEITYAIDYWLTYMFDLKFDPCQIERQHLCYADKETASTSPYADIEEFKTVEPLLVNKDLEPYSYSYADYSEYTQSGDFEDLPENSFILKDFSKQFALEYQVSERECIMICMSPISGAISGTEQAWFNSFKDAFKWDSSVDPLYSSIPAGGIIEAGSTQLQYNYPFDWTVFNFQTAHSDPLFTINTLNNVDYPYDVLFIDNTEDGGVYIKNLLEHLALNNAVSSIICMKVVPYRMLIGMCQVIDSSNEVVDEFSKFEHPNITNYWGSHLDNKKLLCYPFSYLRVTNMATGESKEYHYENFTGHTKIKFVFGGNLGASPRFDLIPDQYKMVNNDGEIDALYRNGNYEERMTTMPFPELPYITDAYLSFLGSQAQSLNLGNTLQNKMEMQAAYYSMEDAKNAAVMGGYKAVAGTGAGLFSAGMGVKVSGGENPEMMEYTPTKVSGVGGALAGAGQSLLNGASGALSAMNAWSNADYQEQLMLHKAAMINQADDLALSNLDSNEVAANYPLGRRAFAVDNYHPAPSDGMEYYSKYLRPDFKFTQVHLRDDIALMYDQFFSNYGFASGKIAKPWVAYYLDASDNNTHHLPDWKMINGFSMTYVKTVDCKVCAPFKIVEEYIKAMFNSGQQFICGDLLS